MMNSVIYKFENIEVEKVFEDSVNYLKDMLYIWPSYRWNE